MRRYPFPEVLVAAAALACASPNSPTPPITIYTEGLQLFARRDCAGVRFKARTLDTPESAVVREALRLFEGYCLELEGNVDAAKEIYHSLIARYPTKGFTFEAALRLLDLERLQRLGTTRAELKQRLDEAASSKSAPYHRSVAPRFRENPIYPSDLRRAGIEGWVLVDFEISADGSVTDPVVLDSDPPFAFDGAAVTAIRNWIYEPSAIEERTRWQVRLNFEIEASEGTEPRSEFYR